MPTPSSDTVLWVVSGGWWGLSLGLLLGGWDALLAPFALLFGVCMAVAEAAGSRSPDPRGRGRLAADLLRGAPETASS